MDEEADDVWPHLLTNQAENLPNLAFGEVIVCTDQSE